MQHNRTSIVMLAASAFGAGLAIANRHWGAAAFLSLAALVLTFALCSPPVEDLP